MRFPSWGVRTKLTLTAVAVITALYALLGITVEFAARQAILGSVDSGLQEMARGFARSHRRPPPGPPRDGGPPRPGEFGSDHQGPDPFRGDPGRRFPPPSPNQVLDLHDSRPRSVWADENAHFPFPPSIPLDEGAVLPARQGREILRTVTFQDEPVRVLTFPVYNPDDHHLEGVIQLTYWLGDIYKTLNTLTGTLLLILPLGIILMGSASLYVVGRTLKPVKDLRSAAAKIEAENLSGRLEVVGTDEFAELADTMNGMLGRLETAFAAQRTSLEQLKHIIQQQRRFTADASHELKTPLTVVKVNASLLRPMAGDDSDAMESIDAIDQAVNRMSKLVQDLLLLARTDSGQLHEQFSPVDLKSVLERGKDLVPCGDKITISDSSEPMTVNGSPFALERLVTNLLENACRHTAQTGKVELRLRSAGNWIELSVSDDGEGIPEEHVGKVFERFHRVDSSRQSDTGGAGLGLAICKGIVEAHGGTISVSSKLDAGTTFTVLLPRVDSRM